MAASPGNPTTLPLESVQQFALEAITAVPEITAPCVSVNVSVPLGTPRPVDGVWICPVTVPAKMFPAKIKVANTTIDIFFINSLSTLRAFSAFKNWVCYFDLAERNCFISRVDQC